MRTQQPTHTCRSASVGIGLRAPHYHAFLDETIDVSHLEVHPENYFRGGASFELLQDIAKHYTISAHCVGLSLGSAHGVDQQHIEKLSYFIERINPVIVSDHVSWSATESIHANDLLPLPYTSESLNVITDNIKRVQDTLQRQLVVENPSTYITFDMQDMSEAEFLTQIQHRTDCGILLDLNNILVQMHNHRFAGDYAERYILSLPADTIKEFHLAGHIISSDHDDMAIDTHSTPVSEACWSLYDTAISHAPSALTTVEWDQDIPELDVLLTEAAMAAARYHGMHENRHANTA